MIKGIGPKCAKQIGMIQESWERQKEVKNIMLFLQGYRVSTGFAAKIYKAYQRGVVGAANLNRLTNGILPV